MGSVETVSSLSSEADIKVIILGRPNQSALFDLGRYARNILLVEQKVGPCYITSRQA
jgi:hypothetical protein